MNKAPLVLLLGLLSTVSKADVLLGNLSDKPVLDRIAYETEYDVEKRIPRWVFYTVKPDYLNTPKRKGRYKKFRPDPDINNPVKHQDYTNSGYARGHLAPFFTSGGDRDNDGSYAGGTASDPDDDLTVYEVNYMSNITPQDQKCFNGAGGVWYKLETHVRKELVQKQGKTVHIFAGPVFHQNKTIEYIGPNKDIAVPHAFFKVLAYTDSSNQLTKVYPFLFPHNRKNQDNQCRLEKKSFFDPSFATSINELELLTGLDFFSDLEDIKEEELEQQINLYKE